MDSEHARALIAEHGIETIKIGGPDLDGIYRGKRLPTSVFLDALDHGFAQCDVIFGWDIAEELVPNLAFTGWESGYPDVVMHPDLNTFAVVPWEDRVASVICDFTDEHGTPTTVSPRQILRRVLDKAAAMGYRAEMAVELEFRILRETAQTLRQKGWQHLEPLSPSNSCYSIHRATGDDAILSRVRHMMDRYGVPIEGYNREHGPGMYEMNLMHGPALTAADQTLLFKNGVKEICQLEGLTATFMAKWDDAEDGCSGHVHQSLWSLDGKTNLFYDPLAPHRLSTLAMQYGAGVLATLPEFCALYAPNINSYKRYVAGTWAPTKVAWGVETRTTALRAVPGSKNSTRLENRVPGCDSNPYLVIAATIAAGLHGIQQALEMPPAARGNAYDLKAEEAPPLPRTLSEATECFASSALAREWFGEAFVDHYVAMRRWEVEHFNRVVDVWQRERYLEML